MYGLADSHPHEIDSGEHSAAIECKGVNSFLAILPVKQPALLAAESVHDCQCDRCGVWKGETNNRRSRERIGVIGEQDEIPGFV